MAKYGILGEGYGGGTRGSDSMNSDVKEMVHVDMVRSIGELKNSVEQEI